jgi:hypothetical protein
MKVLDRKKITDFMNKRMEALYDQHIRDFSGGVQSRLHEWREVKFWKEAIERGEFDSELQEAYIILSETHPSIVDFTYYTDIETVTRRVAELNEMTQRREYWFITVYGNYRNLGKTNEGVGV